MSSRSAVTVTSDSVRHTARVDSIRYLLIARTVRLTAASSGIPAEGKSSSGRGSTSIGG